MESRFALTAARCRTAMSSVCFAAKGFFPIRLDTTKQPLNEKDFQENLLSLLMVFARNVDCLVVTVDMVHCAVAVDGSERRPSHESYTLAAVGFSSPAVRKV